MMRDDIFRDMALALLLNNLTQILEGMLTCFDRLRNYYNILYFCLWSFCRRVTYINADQGYVGLTFCKALFFKLI